jgi:hypothetical protein
MTALIIMFLIRFWLLRRQKRKKCLVVLKIKDKTEPQN